MAEKTLSAKGRRHARNIERSAKRRANDEPCVAGTNKRLGRIDARAVIEKREEQERRITAKRTQRRNFRALDPAQRKLHRDAGAVHKTPGEFITAAKKKAKQQAAEEGGI